MFKLLLKFNLIIVAYKDNSGYIVFLSKYTNCFKLVERSNQVNLSDWIDKNANKNGEDFSPEMYTLLQDFLCFNQPFNNCNKNAIYL